MQRQAESGTPHSAPPSAFVIPHPHPHLEMPAYSVLDLSPHRPGGTAAQAFRNSLDLAQHAERWGYGLSGSPSTTT